MPTTNATVSRNYALPAPVNLLDFDVQRLISALSSIDTDIAGLLVTVGGKAAAAHVHVIGDVTGLQAALDAQALAAHVHTFGSLSDVSLTGAAAGFVVKMVSGSWQAAAIQKSDVSGLQSTLTSLQSQISTVDGGAY